MCVPVGTAAPAPSGFRDAPGDRLERERTFPASTYLSPILLSFIHQKDGRKVRSCDEGTLTLGRERPLRRLPAPSRQTRAATNRSRRHQRLFSTAETDARVGPHHRGAALPGPADAGVVVVAHSRALRVCANPGIMRKSGFSGGQDPAPMCADPPQRTWEPDNHARRSTGRPAILPKTCPRSARAPLSHVQHRRRPPRVHAVVRTRRNLEPEYDRSRRRGTRGRPPVVGTGGERSPGGAWFRRGSARSLAARIVLKEQP